MSETIGEFTAPEGGKVGLITLSLERERVDLARDFGERGARALRDTGFEVLTRDGLVFTTEECVSAAGELRGRGARCIIIQLGTWVFTPTVVDTVGAFDIPFGIWAEDNPQSFSLTAGGIVHGSLDEMGLRHRFFYGSPESKTLMAEIASFVNAASAAQALRGRRVCMIGGRVMGMYTTMADIVQLKQVFGVEVEHMDAVRLYIEAQHAPDDEVSKTREWIEKNLGEIKAPPDVLEKSIRLYIAMRDALREDGYTIAAVKCQDEMINRYASSCLAVSLLNDQGVTASCETDLYAALTMNILSSLSGGPALFGDVNHLDLEKGILRVVNCGSMPTCMAARRGEVDLGPQYEYMGKAGGATTVLVVKESPVTIARLSRVGGRFVLLAAEGETRRVDKSRLKEAREYWPQAFIGLKGDAHALVDNLRSNHMHLCFGHFLRDLRELCAMKDIEFITI